MQFFNYLKWKRFLEVPLIKTKRGSAFYQPKAVPKRFLVWTASVNCAQSEQINGQPRNQWRGLALVGMLIDRPNRRR
jgi:hypothetical protein